jgi:hypothetical protein
LRHFLLAIEDVSVAADDSQLNSSAGSLVSHPPSKTIWVPPFPPLPNDLSRTPYRPQTRHTFHSFYIIPYQVDSAEGKTEERETWVFYDRRIKPELWETTDFWVYALIGKQEELKENDKNHEQLKKKSHCIIYFHRKFVFWNSSLFNSIQPRDQFMFIEAKDSKSFIEFVHFCYEGSIRPEFRSGPVVDLPRFMRDFPYALRIRATRWLEILRREFIVRAQIYWSPFLDNFEKRFVAFEQIYRYPFFVPWEGARGQLQVVWTWNALNQFLSAESPVRNRITVDKLLSFQMRFKMITQKLIRYKSFNQNLVAITANLVREEELSRWISQSTICEYTNLTTRVLGTKSLPLDSSQGAYQVFPWPTYFVGYDPFPQTEKIVEVRTK